MSWRPSWWLKFLKLYWPLNSVLVRATRLPVVGRAVTLAATPFFNKKSFHVSYIPVHAKIDPGVSTVLTQEVIAELIRRSAHRVVIKRCSCRDAKGCKTYPVEDSCMLLGEDTRAINPEIASHISIDEALAHLEKKVALGLIPMTGRVRMDDLYYGVPNRGRMLTICFCCPCCCTVLNNAKYFPREFRSGIVPMKGAHLVVDSAKCAGCGTCAQACFLGAISLQDGHAVHDETRCIGCGRCSALCPQGAVRLEVEDVNAAVEDLYGRIRERVRVE